MTRQQLIRKVTEAVKSADRTFIADGRDNRSITFVRKHLIPALADVGLVLAPATAVSPGRSSRRKTGRTRTTARRRSRRTRR